MCCSKAKQILEGYTNAFTGVKYEFTDDRVRACHKCEHNSIIFGSLWCGICKCWIYAKARVKENTCPRGLWER